MTTSEIQRDYLRTEFGDVHYWQLGSGPDLLLLHQSAQSADEFLDLACILAANFRVVALDLPGHGASATTDHELDVSEYCAAAICLMDALQISKTNVLGHHGGCMLATCLATSYPERFDDVILSGGGYTDPAVADRLLNQPMSRDMPMDEQGDFLKKTWRIYREMSAPKTPMSVTLKPFQVGIAARQRPFDMHFAVLRWDYRSALQRLKHRTLLVKGEYDFFAGDVDALNSDLPDSSIANIAGGGPWLFYEQPERCAEAVRAFLLARP
ncbi:MAG: alpha/beta hydrolase [Gammaproteobacteria bacterium]|nr:alpha/beta hydrolase [Gammaproteobacteria bacterium]